MIDNKNIAISVKDIYKDFILPQSKNSTFKQTFVNIVKKNKKVTQRVLNGVSFDINKGDFFGIVGRNGSGKSTLLKLIAGVYTPTSGSIDISGILTPFIELGVGFNPELSGKDNVFLNGALLGFNRKQMEAMYGEIVEFAELEPFMDQKLKNYSSGMQVRLAFSIAIKAQGDILLLDEVLAVGDEAFQKKCYAYFANLKKQKKTVALVTHSMDIVQQFCNKAMLIENGNIKEIGNPLEISQKYKELFMKKEQKGIKNGDTVKNKDIEIKIDYKNENNILKFDIITESKTDISSSAFVFLISRSNGERVYRWASDINDLGDLDFNKKFKFHLELEDIFPVDSYCVGVSIVNKNRTEEYAVFDNLIEFEKIQKNNSSQWDLYWKPKENYSIKNI